MTLLLLPPCANIAILVYARTITRQEEFAVRYALGASRSRIVVQLFVELLVLAAGAAGVALVLVRLFLWQAPFRGPNDPFWMDYGDVSVATVLFAAGLAVLAAMIAGAVPALQATGHLVQSGLRSLGSRSSVQLGATWTALVVAQVAFSVAVLPAAVEVAWGTLRPGILGPGFAAEEFLTSRITVDRATAPRADGASDQRTSAASLGDRHVELVRQLEAELGVSAVTVAAAVPGREPWARVEVDGDSPPGATFAQSSFGTEFNRVDEAFFDVFDARLLAGRRFSAADFESAQALVIVNQTLARYIAGDESPLGRRVRYITEPASVSEAWYEVVGVVADVPSNTNTRTMYHPMAPGQALPVSLMLRVGDAQSDVAGRIREITTMLDPTLRVDEILSLDEVYRRIQLSNNVAGLALAVVMVSVLLLSAAGLYALMSFTVNQRRREIGIRSALGAQPRRLLAGIFKRALGQVGAGAVGGVLAALLIGYYLPLEEMGSWNVPGIIPGAAVLMVVIGLLAAFGPARRGLRVDPADALRDG